MGFFSSWDSEAARGAGNESQETSQEKAEKDISAAVASLDKRVSGSTSDSGGLECLECLETSIPVSNLDEDHP